MTIRRDDAALGIKAPQLDKKGFPAGGDDDTGFNSQLPPGEFIENQMYAEDTKRIAALKPSSALANLRKE